MRLTATGITEMAVELSRDVERRVQVIGELARDPQGAGAGGPSMQDAIERRERAQELGDRKAEDEAELNLVRAEMRVWWPDFPARPLIEDLYRRADLRMAGRGPDDSRRLPDHSKGFMVATHLLAQVQGKGGLDSESEARDVAVALTLDWLSLPEQSQTSALEKYIESSETSRAHFDALNGIEGIIIRWGESPPFSLKMWSVECYVGLGSRPPLADLSANRPVNSAHLERDYQILFTLKILREVGVPPYGNPVSGCRVVAEALELSEESVKRIWKARNSPESMLLRHLEAVGERNGLDYDPEA